MASYKSVAAAIQECEYWLRLGTFLHEPLKYGLLDVLHNSTNDPTYVGLPSDPTLLYQEFSKHGKEITQFVKKRVLQQDQVDLLLPPNGNKTDSSKFDVTIIVILIINFTTLKPPLNGWKDKNPPPHDRSKGAGVVRGRQWRNFVHHTEPKDIDKAKFNQQWAEGTRIINDLGYQYNTNKLKTISLDHKHDLVLKSLFSLIANFKTKHDSLESKQDAQTKIISSLTQQCNKIANEVQHLHLDKETKKDHSNTESSSCCLKIVLQYISKEIEEEEAEELLDRLNVQVDGDLVDKLKAVPWENIKAELEMMGRADIIEYLRKNSLITRGLQNASCKLRNHYKIELIDCLVEQPLSSIEMDSQYAEREDLYIDLVVLPSSTVDEDWNNSDRDALMKQSVLDKSTSEKAVDSIIQPQDELIFIRGVAGIGKSTLIDMFTFKWAKKELRDASMFDFVFKFTCRDLNQILNEFETLEQLFKLQYPNIFCGVTLQDLAEVSDRVLIIIDGLDELKDIYQMDGMKASSVPQVPFLQTFYNLINPKYTKLLENRKTIVCGRPKACEFVKNQFSDIFKIKTIEVCGFNHTNVQKYVLNFFDNNEKKAQKVQKIIASSYNLKIMSTVPVFLWVICNVYNEDLIERPIHTNTELYFYTCLIFLRNHFQGSSSKYRNLLDIINDQLIVDVVYTLMVLSVKTYMNNQVLFTDEDIKRLHCPVHLEQTGFIVKYSRSNTKKAIYQFRHLVLQEFLCGMHLCVTKGVSPFLSNRELSSCLPTILGIHRIIKEKENEIFLQFYKALQASNEKLSNVFAKIATPFRSRSYNRFIKKHLTEHLDLPLSMVKNETLLISDLSSDCRDFLNLFKESNCDVHAPLITVAEIKMAIHKDINNILNLLDKLKIGEIRKFQFLGNYLDEDNSLDLLRLYDMTAGPNLKTFLSIRTGHSTYYGRKHIQCTSETLLINVYYVSFSEVCFSHLSSILKATSDTIYIGIEWDHECIGDGQTFLQDVAKYAIDHRKNIYLSTLPNEDQMDKHPINSSFISKVLEEGNVDAKSQYIHIIHWTDFKSANY